MFSYLRSLFFTIPLAFSITGVLIWVSYAASLVRRSWTDRLFRFWAGAVMWSVGARHSASGVENVDPARSYVVVSNHLSLIDTPLLVRYLPLTVRFLAKRELFAVPVMGGYMKRTGHIPIDRGNARAALQSIAEAARALRDGGRSILIYPEGTRSMDGRMQTFKDGAAVLAIRAGLPILPCAVEGTRDVLPARGVVLMPARVHIRVGQPIETAHLTIKDRESLTRDLEVAVAALRGAAG
jgi:1-acyl-sn-glycerol-3-phosphate acyltransferase